MEVGPTCIENIRGKAYKYRANCMCLKNINYWISAAFGPHKKLYLYQTEDLPTKGKTIFGMKCPFIYDLSCIAFCQKTLYYG